MSLSNHNKVPLALPSTIALAVLVCVYAFICYQRNVLWANEFTLWEDTAKKSPSKSRVYTYLGIANAKDKDFRAALQNFSRAAALDPESIEVRHNLGAFYSNIARYDLAEREYRFILGKRPDLIEPYMALAGLYAMTGEHNKSAGVLTAAFEKWPRNQNVGPRLGTALARAGRLVEAETVLRKVLSRNARNAAALNGLGNIRMVEGRLTEALNYYRLAMGANPGDLEPIYNAAMVHEQVGNKAEARLLYQSFVEKAKDNDAFSVEVKSAQKRIESLR